MLVTRETDYALRALRAITDGKKKTLTQISKEEGIPKQFSYKILKKLEKGGYLRVFRGKAGGYIIADDFKDRNLYELIKVTENEMEMSPCVVPGYRCEAHKNSDEPCGINLRLSSLQQMLDNELKAINLYDMLAK